MRFREERKGFAETDYPRQRFELLGVRTGQRKICRRWLAAWAFPVSSDDAAPLDLVAANARGILLDRSARADQTEQRTRT